MTWLKEILWKILILVVTFLWPDTVSTPKEERQEAA